MRGLASAVTLCDSQVGFFVADSGQIWMTGKILAGRSSDLAGACRAQGRVNPEQ